MQMQRLNQMNQIMVVEALLDESDKGDLNNKTLPTAVQDQRLREAQRSKLLRSCLRPGLSPWPIDWGERERAGGSKMKRVMGRGERVS